MSLYMDSNKSGEVVMPNRDKKGPRERSPKPSKPRGGDKKGGCKPVKK